MLPEFNKSDIRLLTAEEKNILDESKAFLLPRVSPYEKLDDSLIIAAYNNVDAPYNRFQEIFLELLSEVASDKVTIEQKRLLRIAAYVEAWSEDLENDEE